MKEIIGSGSTSNNLLSADMIASTSANNALQEKENLLNDSQSNYLLLSTSSTSSASSSAPIINNSNTYHLNTLLNSNQDIPIASYYNPNLNNNINNSGYFDT